MSITFPDGRSFAFSIVDDTDNSTLAICKPFYALLMELGMRTTKTVWVYPSRDQFHGDSLQDENYRDYVLFLQEQGFEIGMHNVGSGAFGRAEILAGIDEFKRILGAYPRLFANHGFNPDNLYWGAKRFAHPVGWLFRVLRDRIAYSGEVEGSPYYWGDKSKELIRYVRNHTFDEIDLNRRDRLFPYHDPAKPAVNYWFPSVDARNIDQLLAVMSFANMDRLADEGGVCILYTHVAYGLVRNGEVHPELRRRLEYLARKDGCFVPTSTLLDSLLAQRGGKSVAQSQLFLMDAYWVLDHLRILARERWLGRRE